MSQEIRISCDDCVMQGTEHCADCVVSFLCGPESQDALVLDFAEARAIRMLSKAGLVPHVAHQSKSA